MIYGDDPIKWNERESNPNDPLGLNTYTYVPDITAIMQSGNLYVYCMNNPIMFVDPIGEDATSILSRAWTLGGIISQLDSPLPGPADLIGAVIGIGGTLIAGGVLIWENKERIAAGAQWIGDKIRNAWARFTGLFASGKGNPHDLEKGMSKNQKGMFQREIEDWKKYNGMRPNDNTPWEVLVALAEYVKEAYK